MKQLLVKNKAEKKRWSIPCPKDAVDGTLLAFVDTACRSRVITPIRQAGLLFKATILPIVICTGFQNVYV